MAHKYDVHVTALEIEPNRVHIAEELTRRCSLSSHVHMICADASKYRVDGMCRVAGDFDNPVQCL